MNVDIPGLLKATEPMARSIASTKGVSPRISQDDMLFDFLVRAVFTADHEKAIEAYFMGGEDCANRFAGLVHEYFPDGPKNVLEFASGYGRVTRYARKVLQRTEWICCDIHPQAIAFLASELGIPGSVSSADPARWSVSTSFDVVFALSFLSHTPDKTFAAWVERLFSAVAPGGLLIFTTHGAVSLANMKRGGLKAEFDDRGFYWNSNSDQRDLSPDDYGTSAVTLRYVQSAVAPLHRAELVRFQQAFWWGHQDLYVIRKAKVG
ncbi:bifunctional 2-polyprenyl-6-hydroxyphenol methylase/3-demethylubiquinol 3-O-methyltransferase UbiG [Mesorhizobium sp. SARCC-RB16n]|uniref:class I SAM-dependent methyltransferase n=1 Tax=Mesorhizobium sp. SARCC-RB16n TaxID=2116687 RepID=UPI001666444C|nr:class I SAM-dependent methyltransferase [Mesorhizobium sp. SARCC-RB16n]